MGEEGFHVDQVVVNRKADDNVLGVMMVERSLASTNMNMNTPYGRVESRCQGPIALEPNKRGSSFCHRLLGT